jgi:hypothetical protein
MKTITTFAVIILTALNIFSAEYYVDAFQPDDTGIGTNWATAKQTIQAAVDLAIDSDTVWVTNGIYNSGGAVTPGYVCMNRVVITNDITVRSVNGPEHTFIVGEGPLGSSAVRGGYMSAGVLSGFTITNGYTMTSGNGFYDKAGGGINMRAGDGVVTNCVLTGNSARYDGGGSYYGTLNNCTLTGNSANDDGGGSYYSTLNNCTLTGNSANDEGGGSYYGTLNNCRLIGNLTNDDGGGSYNGTLNNCTLFENSAESNGGGMYNSSLRNCIVYYNTSGDGGDNWYDSTPNIVYSCTTPDPGSTGNITNSPMRLSASHIHADSPCVGAGSSSYASGVDIDGDAWAAPPSIGCDEPRSPYSGDLTVSIIEDGSSVATGYNLSFTADIFGETASIRWVFGDGTVISNANIANHAWSDEGIYDVILTAFNTDNPAGVSATVQVYVCPRDYYVNASSVAPASPYNSWTTAATNIQDATDEALKVTGAIVWVTNGVYDTGGAVTPGYACMNRVVITNDITVQSVNGPEHTFIVGEGPLGSTAVRGAYLSAGVLSGFTVTNGFTMTSGDSYYDNSGGGVNMYDGDGVVTNCVLTGNSASVWGGGSYEGTLMDCTLSDNSTDQFGGGCYHGTLTGCTLSGNYAGDDGGGCCWATLINCTLSSNHAVSRGGGSYNSTLTSCVLSDNTAGEGGGNSGGTLTNCELTDNSSQHNFDGGGTYYGTLINCVLRGNSSGSCGGGSYNGTLNNCTLVGNSARIYGGGFYQGTVRNCIIYNNTADSGYDNGTGWSGDAADITYSCITPDADGTGNITNNPQFVDASAVNYRLQSTSPCINAGNNAYAEGNIDFAGNPRIGDTTVDMGAHEFFIGTGDFDEDGLPNEWETEYFGNITDANPSITSANGKDTLLDAYTAGLDPNDPESKFMTIILPDNVLHWSCISGRVYSVYWTTNLLESFQPLETNIPWTCSSFTNSTDTPNAYFKIDVQLEE